MQNQTPSPAVGKVRINIDEKGLEFRKWKSGAPFPVSSGICDLSSYCNNAFDFHWHDGPELSVVIEGRMEYLVNDKSYLMEVGDCVFANSGAMHSGHAVDDGGCRYVTVSFLNTAIDSDPSGYFAEKYFGGVMDSEMLSSLFFKADCEESRAVASLCVDICHANRSRAEGWELEVRGMLCRLWSLLRREADKVCEAGEDNSVSVARIKKAIRYMNENYRNKLSLEDIAVSCNLSRSEFCRCFKRITKQTPFDYLMDLRVRKSLRLLSTDGCSVTEAALSSGFSGSSYYTEVFRRYMNCTPREYMKRVGKRQSE